MHKKSLCILDYLFQDESSIHNHVCDEISKTNAIWHLTGSIPNLNYLGHVRTLMECNKQVHLIEQKSMAVLDSYRARK